MHSQIFLDRFRIVVNHEGGLIVVYLGRWTSGGHLKCFGGGSLRARLYSISPVSNFPTLCGPDLRMRYQGIRDSPNAPTTLPQCSLGPDFGRANWEPVRTNQIGRVKTD